MPENVEKAEKAAAYTKSNILKLKQFRARRDVIQVLLDEKKTYTIAAVMAEIETFMKGGAK